jgi:chaperonin GroES
LHLISGLYGNELTGLFVLSQYSLLTRLTTKTTPTGRFPLSGSATTSLPLCHPVSLARQFWRIGTLFAKRRVRPARQVPRDLAEKSKTKTIKNITIMTIKPLADRVLVLPAPAEEKVGGIIIPDTAKEKPQRGKVIAVGEGTKDEKMILKADDVVLYGKYAGTEIENEGTKYLMMRQSDVLAIVTE